MAALFIFTVVFGFHLFPCLFSSSSQKEDEEIHGEMKDLLKQTFNICRSCETQEVGSPKEKELLRKQESVGKEIKDSYDSQLRLLLIIKVVAYFLLVCWFWRTPVASISRHLVQPFVKLLSWGIRSPLSDYVMVGVIPWLVLCTGLANWC